MSEQRRPDKPFWCPECERPMRYAVHAIGDGPTHDCVRIEPAAVVVRLEAAERRVEKLEEALTGIHTFTELREGESHRHYGIVCGSDACCVCLIEASARSALSTTEEPAR